MTDDTGVRRVDAEQVAIEATRVGPAVDPPPRLTTWADIVTADRQLPPVIPAWLRQRDQRRQVAAHTVRLAGHVSARHLTRSPKYAALVALWAPVGAVRLAWRAWRWAYDMEQWGERQAAATRNDVDAYLALMRQADKHRGNRVPVLLVLVVLLAAAVLAVALLTPWWVRWPGLVATAVGLAWAGRPADKPILDRVQVGPRFTRLTAEQVRTALVAIGAAKEPAQLRFPQEIHRDGPGYLARVDLPAGGEAIKIIEARGKLSSALRLPVDQVWPSIGPDHAGQVDLWVGTQPASKMPRAKWPLATPTARTSCFEPVPFGVDQRGRPVYATLFQRNFLIGGQPGSGKTFAGRALAFAALLDPTAEVWLAAFKASEDFHDAAEFCSRYVCGVDDVTMQTAEQMVTDGLAEVRRRQTLLGKLKREGKIAEGATNAELAAAGIGLHPLVLIFDEVHELFLESKTAAENMIRLIKQGRSAGVIVILITQVADKDSVPPNVTRCVSSRWCLSVADQVANDQIMGTGAYKRGASGTAFRPGADAGWGTTMGMADTAGPARAFYPTADELAVVLSRIRQLRTGSGYRTETDRVNARDMLADARQVLRTGEAGLSWQTLAERLAELDPDVYGGLTGDMARESLARYDIASKDVKVAGRNVKGVRRTALDEAQRRRELES